MRIGLVERYDLVTNVRKHWFYRYVVSYERRKMKCFSRAALLQNDLD